MKTARRPAGPRLLRRIVLAGLVTGLAIVLAAPGEAFALFSATPAAPAVPVTAATIGAPGGVTATAASSSTATLSWTAPSAHTGYTLSQSPGTLAGCSATPSAATTTCTAAGLSPGTAYTWTLTAAYNNWKGSAATASATTPAVVGASLLKGATDSTSGSRSSSVSSVTTTRGADLLILVYRQASNASLGISSVAGTAISGTPALVTSKAFNTPATYELWAYHATGTGTSGGTVTVTFSSSNNTSTIIDVVQLSGDKAGSPVAQSAATAGSGTAAAGAAVTGASSEDGEIFFAGLATSTTMSTPSGYSALDAPATGASAVRGAWFSSAASATAITTRLGASRPYGTIEIEINHG